MNEPQAPHQLEYATAQQPADSWLTRLWKDATARWRRLPLPLAMMILLIPAYVVVYSVPYYGIRLGMSWTILNRSLALAPLFLAGAIGRGRWRDFLIALTICAAAIVVAESPLQPGPHGFHPYRWLAVQLVPLLGLGVAEWIALKRTERGSILWTLLAAAGIACAMSIADIWFRLAAVETPLRDWRIVEGSFYYGDQWGLRPVVMAIVAGFCIPRAIVAKRASRRGIVIGIAGGAAIAAFAALFGPALMPLSRSSVQGDGPFVPAQGLRLIDAEGKSSDFECLYDVLKKSGYEKGLFGRHSSTDLSRGCADVLARHDPQRMGPILSSMLRPDADYLIALKYGNLFAGQHLYETAPILLRFSYLEIIARADVANTHARGQRSHETPRIIHSLELMGVPQAAEVIAMYEWFDFWQARDPAILDDETRRRLTQLVGRDAGPYPDHWIKLGSGDLSSAPTQLPRELRDELNQILKSGSDCVFARSRLADAGIDVNTVTLPDFGAVTTEAFVSEVDRYVARVNEAVRQAKGE